MKEEKYKKNINQQKLLINRNERRFKYGNEDCKRQVAELKDARRAQELERVARMMLRKIEKKLAVTVENRQGGRKHC